MPLPKPLALWWALWKSRNDFIFRGKVKTHLSSLNTALNMITMSFFMQPLMMLMVNLVSALPFGTTIVWWVQGP